FPITRKPIPWQVVSDLGFNPIQFKSKQRLLRIENAKWKDLLKNLSQLEKKLNLLSFAENDSDLEKTIKSVLEIHIQESKLRNEMEQFDLKEIIGRTKEKIEKVIQNNSRLLEEE